MKAVSGVEGGEGEKVGGMGGARMVVVVGRGERFVWYRVSSFSVTICMVRGV